jgi:hypothetical protein
MGRGRGKSLDPGLFQMGDNYQAVLLAAWCSITIIEARISEARQIV